MERFRYLPHTADVQFRSYGRDFRESLENAALALLGTMLDIKKIGRADARRFEVAIKESAETESQLAWFTLQDILSKVDSRKLNAYSFRIVSLGETEGGMMRLKGSLMCKRVHGDNTLLSVKAVTPHNLVVKKRGGKVSINVVVDV